MDVKSAIEHYCNYQERCHKEVRQKLYELGCRKNEVEQLISELINEKLLNEERYARSIVRGRFRLKHWGKRKIIQYLKLQQISEYCIVKALTEIDGDEYFQTLEKLADKKWQTLKTEKNKLAKRYKLYRFLLQKGYETDLIDDVYKGLIHARA